MSAEPLEALEASLRPLGSAVVAMSGGVDSAVVAAAAHRALGPRALAVTLTGPAVPREEVARAAEVARSIGIVHRLVSVDPVQDPRYASNPSNRCYFCRSHEGDALTEIARQEGYRVVLDGIHEDDLGDDRPGVRAMDERGVRHPLLELHLRKADVRAMARQLKLPNQDAPSNSCLASRVAHGHLIDPELLARVDRAEEWLRAEGFRQVRVRTDGSEARVEVGREELARLLDPETQDRTMQTLRSLGFRTVRIDPEGYRPSGARAPTPQPRAFAVG